LLKELESQKYSLKTFYQNQLEKAITAKVKEFQSQMNQVEELLRNDAKHRERLVAERAIKQIELINQK
jgi:centrobin